MNNNLLENVNVLSEHYVNRFKFLLEGEMLNLQVKRPVSYTHLTLPTILLV